MQIVMCCYKKICYDVQILCTLVANSQMDCGCPRDIYELQLDTQIYVNPDSDMTLKLGMTL